MHPRILQALRITTKEFDRMFTRREWLKLTALGAAVGVSARQLFAAAAPIPITVYKSPTCGCCGKWVEHMKAGGFAVTVHDMEDVSPKKKELGIAEALWSCHTGVVAGYAIEGHVPADVVQQLLKEKPKVTGLAVPGMPPSSPGMDMGHTKFDILTFDKAGKTKVYATR
jgi:hypothetical protein